MSDVKAVKNIRGVSRFDRIARIFSIIPVGLWITIFTILPFLILFLYSFWQVSEWELVREFTFGNYLNVFTDKLFYILLLKTLGVAIAVTSVCLVLGYGVAFFAANYSGRAKNVMYILVIIPLWTSYIVRIFSWRVLLGREGIINNFLVYLRILREPADILLYSSFSVFLALIGILLPFMVLPIFSTIEKIPKSIYEAASDLGASKARTFMKVIFPISLPGVLAGSFLVFVLSVGDYITPRLLGGSGGILLGWEIYSKFGLAFQWPLGSAMSVVLLIIILLILNLMNRGGALEEL